VRRGTTLGRRARPASHTLVTGGCGFVGTNLASRLLDDGRRVVVFDDLSRPGVEQNLRFLRETYGERIAFENANVRNGLALRRAVDGADSVFHLAAQVAVTTSLVDPVDDFRTNVEGTLRLLEEIRRRDEPPFLLFTSTNKVYGSLPDLELERVGDRWEPVDAEVRAHGLAEERPLHFSTPYGCSKGAADQYVLDYASSYGLPSVVFRMSCIYGPHQHGNEDQGWVAHFAIRALEERPITLYGDGAQVRDILFVEDLVEAMLLARDRASELAGSAFNMGGGAENSVSLHEVIEQISDLHGRAPDVRFAEERQGDQRYYVADTRRFRAATDWRPVVSAQDGVERLYRWLADRRAPLGERLRAVAR
jgi:CDP-paratose 2-epimerase